MPGLLCLLIGLLCLLLTMCFLRLLMIPCTTLTFLIVTFLKVKFYFLFGFVT